MSKLKDNMMICDDCLTEVMATYDYISITESDERCTCYVCKKRRVGLTEVLSKKEWNRRMQEEKDNDEQNGEVAPCGYTFY